MVGWYTVDTTDLEIAGTDHLDSWSGSLKKTGTSCWFFVDSSMIRTI
ncbi:MAG TPA: hypothetical protein PLM96_00700 [Methanoregulaceae archaeon]|nr:hypothetical protein [Methanolinea sp.]MCC7567537.1 hypothetical protein [Methanoregulaceae archaeon]MDD3090169.1 hypothetical protein [Methanoregulaceae archaeon]MDD5048201.1 hypothetical protein [Methanoregulaceae archaeon]MDD5684463.1 hypothetical protein [Methanoregulaceae archaeon]